MGNDYSHILKEGLLPLYSELTSKKYKNIDYFCLQWGKEYPKEKNKGILFIGRAVNGWIETTNDVNTLFGETEQRIFNRDDQMEWVENEMEKGTNSKVSKSFFWKVVKGTTQKVYNINGKGWSKKIAWSNLYKVSPHKGGNPTTRMINMQKEICKQITKKEIEVLSPQHIVLLTGLDWAQDILPDLKETKAQQIKTWDNNKYIVSTYLHEGRNYIVSVHPERKNIQSHINSLAELIKID